MKTLYSSLIIGFITTQLSAQTVFWTEDFGTGCNTGQLASAYAGTNGSWSVSDFTAGNNASNKFYVSATEAGMGTGNCGNGCLASGGTNRTLHVGGVEVVYMNFTVVEQDRGAAYNVGGIQGFEFISETNIVAQSPFIDCSGRENITLSFEYIEGGDMALDDANWRYYNGTSWVTLPLAKTNTCAGNQGVWTAFSYNLPSEINNLSNFRLAFGWVNNDDGEGSDPSFAVDNITLSTDVATNILAQDAGAGLRLIQNDNSIEVTFIDVDEEIMIVRGFDILGREVVNTSGNGSNKLVVSKKQLQGLLILQIETKKGTRVRKMVLR